MNSRKVLGTVICAISALATSSAIALGQHEPAAYRLIASDAEDFTPSSAGISDSQSDYVGSCNQGCSQSCYCPRWTATADFIIFDRIGSKSQTLVEGVPLDTNDPTGVQLLNANDFRQGFAGGPRVSLIRHGDRCYDLELLYFQIDGWNSSRLITREQGQGLIFTIPGPLYYRTLDPMQFDYASKLYNAEFNVRWNPSCRVTMLAGFRWIELRENLEGGVIAPLFQPFWDTTTKNNLYGFQIGSDAMLWQRGCFSIDGLLKAGIYGNHAEQRSTIIEQRTITSGSDSTTHTSFLGEIGLQCKYQVTCNLTLRAGYEAIWLEGVALAPGQIHESNFTTREFGIDTSGGVFYHGATAGFEYNF